MAVAVAVAEEWIRLFFFKVRKDAEPKWNTLGQRVTARLLTTKNDASTEQKKTKEKKQKKKTTHLNVFQLITCMHFPQR